MIIVGVTGSFSSGKSQTVLIFKRFGAKVFDADKAAKQVVRKGAPVTRAIVKLFGRDFLKKNKELDRKKLAGYVFSHPRALKKLNILIHPAVIVECFKTIERFRDRKGLLVLDVPLLFESNMGHLADYTVVVSATKATILKRAKRKGVSAALAKKILSTQWPLKRKARLADFVIRNDGSIRDLERQVRKILEEIKNNREKVLSQFHTREF